MQNKVLNIILAIVFGIAVLVVTFYFGVLIQTQKTWPRLEKSTKLIEALSSKVIPVIVANGEVTNISGRTLTITREGESISIPILEDAEIAFFELPKVEQGNITPLKKKLEFTDIKVGDFVSVILKIEPDGEFKGSSVSVFPTK